MTASLMPYTMAKPLITRSTAITFDEDLKTAFRRDWKRVINHNAFLRLHITMFVLDTIAYARVNNLPMNEPYLVD